MTLLTILLKYYSIYFSTMAILKSALAKQWANSGDACTSRLMEGIWTILCEILKNCWHFCHQFVYNFASNIAQYWSQYYVKYCEQYQTIIYKILYNIRTFYGQYYVKYWEQYWTKLNYFEQHNKKYYVQ